MANLNRVIYWVRDQDPSAAHECLEDRPSPGGGNLGQDVLAAFNSFGEDWAEALAAA